MTNTNATVLITFIFMSHFGLVHTLVSTAANEHDITQTHALLHGEEQQVYGDSGYLGAGKREENKDKDVE